MNLYRTMREFSRRGNVMHQTETRLDEVIKENEQLQRKYAQVQTQTYVETQARERINASKDGEVVLLVPTILPVSNETPISPNTTSSWRKWMKLFF